MTLEQQANKLSKEVLQFDIKQGHGGRRSKGHSSGYGLTLKYLIYLRGMTLQQFAKCIGVSPQTLNYIVNEREQKDFLDEDIEKYRKVLKLSKQLFTSIAKIVDETMR